MLHEKNPTEQIYAAVTILFWQFLFWYATVVWAQPLQLFQICIWLFTLAKIKLKATS